MAKAKFFDVKYILKSTGEAKNYICFTQRLDSLYRAVKTGELLNLSITPTTDEKAREQIKQRYANNR